MARQKKQYKINISQVDLKSFLYEDLSIDPYWDDLYNPKTKVKNKRHSRYEN